jgi:hypothetical protein
MLRLSLSILPQKPLPRFLLCLFLSALGLLALLYSYESDANFVTYRFASNWSAGRGLIYWTTGPDVTTYPLVPLLMALPRVDVQPVGGFLSLLAIATGALFLMRLAEDRWIAGLAYILASVMQPSPVILVMLAFALAGLDAIRYRRWLLAGLLLGLAILTEPTAIGLAALAVILIIRAGDPPWRYLIPVILLPVGVLALIGLGRVYFISMTPGTFSLALPALAFFALIRQRAAVSPVSAVLAAWSAFIGLLAALGGTAPTQAILPGVILVAMSLPARWWVLVAILIDMGLRVALGNPGVIVNTDQVYPPLDAGLWLGAHTGPDTTIATDEIGLLSFEAGRRVIDMSGSLQANPLDRFFMIRNAPDVVVLRDGVDLLWPGFATTYARMTQIGYLTIYQRVVNWGALDDHGVDVNLSDKVGRQDLRLSNVAIGNTLHPGDLVRVRLDWELAYAPSFEVEIKLDLLDAAYKGLGGVLDKLPPSEWHAGRMSTYHALTLSGDAQAGRISLFLNVGIRAGTMGTLKVAEVDIVR